MSLFNHNWVVTIVLFLSITILGCETRIGPVPGERFYIIKNGELQPGFDIGVDTKEERRNWIKFDDNKLILSYPENQEWGFVSFVVGHQEQDTSLSENFAPFNVLKITMEGNWNPHELRITNRDVDDEQEEKREFCALIPDDTMPNALSYSIPLDYLDREFDATNRENLNIPVLIIFIGNNATELKISEIYLDYVEWSNATQPNADGCANTGCECTTESCGC